MKFSLACVVAIVAMTATVSNGGQNGCAWSGCQNFAGSICSTGGSGRPIQKRSKMCGGFGRKHFCCDQDCGYQECGKSCENLNFKTYGDMESIPCEFPYYVPNHGTFQIASQQYFCCP